VNYSDIHGQFQGGKWDSKPGPASGINLGYSLSKTIGFQTGVNFSTVYYEHKEMSYPIYYDIRYYLSSSSYYPGLTSMVPYSGTNNMDFSFVRIPLLFTVIVPAALQLDLKAGIFFSFLRDYNMERSNYYYYPAYFDYYYPDEKPAKNDFGYIFSSGLSYPLSDKFKASFNAAYITGRKPFLENLTYKHGSSEFTLGIEYTGFLKNRHPERSPVSEDSLSKRVIVTLTGGLDYSWNGAEEPNGDYNGCFGPSLGFSLKFPLGKKTFFQTGFTFERKGYSIRDSSTSFFRLTDGYRLYDVDTKILTDYAVIPALFTFFPGNRQLLFFSTGPWLGLKLNARTVGIAYNEESSGYSYQVKETTVNYDLEGIMGNYDIGWLFGCGIEIPLANKYVVDLSLQYSPGFRQMYDDLSNPGPGGEPELLIKNRTVSFVMGFRIPSY
jgi:hypothetical protein